MIIEVSPQIQIGDGQPLALIAGPCVIESEEHVHFLAREIAKIAGAFIFKASFDKANRSSVTSYRGPGLVGWWRGEGNALDSSDPEVKSGRATRPSQSTIHSVAYS